MFLVCSFICVVFLCLFIIFFLPYCVWGLLSPGLKFEFFLPFGFCPPGSSGLCKLCIGWDLCWVCLFVFPLMGKPKGGGNPVCWWLGLYFCFVCCLDEVSCTECYWWLGDAGSCIRVVSFVWVLTIWYSLGLVLWQSRVLESVLPLQRLGARSLIPRVQSFYQGLIDTELNMTMYVTLWFPSVMTV